MQIENDIMNSINEWSAPPFDSETIGEICTLKESLMWKELEDRFYRRLEFGTGGMRGKIGAGTNRMNIYTVGLATQALCDYLKEKGLEKGGIVISRDSRIMSEEFAHECASIISANGITVYLFETIMPTPLCSYAIRKYAASAGIMITASHNPPEYNGYKVFWNDGAQIVPPVDEELIQKVLSLRDIGVIKKTGFQTAIDTGIIQIIGNEILSSYKADLEQSRLYRPVSPSKLKVVYTPLHGTGIVCIPEILRESGYTDIHIVEEQSKADGNFPTVKYPNPEEKDALAMAVALAEKENADIILATDPDADRVGIGIRHNGGYLLVDGNQAGSLLLYFVLSQKHKLGTLTDTSTVIKTIITTRMQELIAAHFGCKITNVLTGFKWIADQIRRFDEQSASGTFVFGGEESYGYLPVSFVRDKDAVSSCVFFCDMADCLAGQGFSVADQLDNMYRQFGYFSEQMHYIVLDGAEGMQKIGRIMDHFRNTPPQTIADSPVKTLRDYKNELEICAGERRSFDALPVSDVLQFSLENESMFTIRPSGTEPKIKFYISAYGRNYDGNNDVKKSVNNELRKIRDEIDAIISKIQ